MDGVAPHGEGTGWVAQRGELDDLPRFAREHHLSYDVEEESPAADAQEAATFEVRLFATHGEDRLEAPTCPRCVELTTTLREFATRVVTALDATSWAEILEPAPVLYTAANQHGPDEVSVVLRVLDERADAPGEGRVGTLEHHLKSLGIERR